MKRTVYFSSSNIAIGVGNYRGDHSISETFNLPPDTKIVGRSYRELMLGEIAYERRCRSLRRRIQAVLKKATFRRTASHRR